MASLRSHVYAGYGYVCAGVCALPQAESESECFRSVLFLTLSTDLISPPLICKQRSSPAVSRFDVLLTSLINIQFFLIFSDAAPIPTEPPFKVFVSNLPYSCTREDIERCFSSLHGKVNRTVLFVSAID